MITNEYTTLVRDGEEIRILPNVEFDEVPAGYMVTAYALIKNNDKSEILGILKPGELSHHIKEEPLQEVSPLSELSIKQLKEVARNEGISFPSKATKKKLIEILGA